MSEVNICPCCSGLKYEDCCQPFHQGESVPTAEKLMRSRYSAYVICLPDYLINTTYPAKRKGLVKEEIVEWSKENKWLKLEIVKSNTSVVEFKAHFQDENRQLHIHHERSDFTIDEGRWYYVKGKFF